MGWGSMLIAALVHCRMLQYVGYPLHPIKFSLSVRMGLSILSNVSHYTVFTCNVGLGGERGTSKHKYLTRSGSVLLDFLWMDHNISVITFYRATFDGIVNGRPQTSSVHL